MASTSQSVNEEEVQDTDKRGYELMMKLKSLVKKGSWEDEDSKFFAQLLCEDVARIFKLRMSDGRCPSNPAVAEAAVSGKKRRLAYNQEEALAASSLNLEKLDGVDGKKPLLENKNGRIWNKRFIPKENCDDGFDWRKYGSKKIKNETYKRDYYKCSSKGCPARKQVHEVNDDGYFEIIYADKHNCRDTLNDRLIAQQVSAPPSMQKEEATPVEQKQQLGDGIISIPVEMPSGFDYLHQLLLGEDCYEATTYQVQKDSDCRSGFVSDYGSSSVAEYGGGTV